MSIKIEFKGVQYWFLGDSFKEDGAIAPLEHCDAKGNVKVLEESFAHYFARQDRILRYGGIIGSKKDLIIVKKKNGKINH